jgi:hypothetical protein
MKEGFKISKWSKDHLEEQGYNNLSHVELSKHRLGIRFAYVSCGTLVALGLALKSQTILIIANGIAFLGMLPPYHPFDYLFNYGVRFLVGRPKLPARSNQGRFACAIATVMLGAINYFLYQGNFTAFYITGAALLTSAVLVGFFDFCIPSKTYNALFKQRSKQVTADSSTPAMKG